MGLYISQKGIEEAPIDGNAYARKDAGWVIDVAFVDAPIDGEQYSRKNAGWEIVALTASAIPIVDSGSIITATDVEGALQENRTAIDLNTAKQTNQVDNKIVSGKLWGSHEGIGYFVLDDLTNDYVLFKVIIPDGSKNYEVRFIVSWDVSPAAAGAIDWNYESKAAGEAINVKPAATGSPELVIGDAVANGMVIITMSIPNTAINTGEFLTALLDVNAEDIGGEDLKVHGAYLVVV